MAAFTGQLRTNEIFSALYNMIISQQVFADNIDGLDNSLVDRARVDGSLYGDTKLYYSTDVLKSAAWGNDAEAANLLALHRPPAPACQAIYLDVFRQICLTVDDYMSKRAWGDEGSFQQFTSVMKGWIGDTKKVYDNTTYNAYVGTAASATGKQTQTVTVTGTFYGTEEANRAVALAIGEKIANIKAELKDCTRDYNDNQYLRSFNPERLTVIFNTAWLNKIRKTDLPTIFHKDGVVEDLEKNAIPARFFGTVNSAQKVADGTATRSLIEQEITYSGTTTNYFAGDLIVSGATAPAGTSYQEDPNIVCKIIELPPYMSAFEVGTSFFNPKALTETNYLTFGHNTLEYLKNYPFITVKFDAVGSTLASVGTTDSPLIQQEYV